MTKIPAAWRLVPLAQLGRWSGGGTPSKSNLQFWTADGIPWVSPKDMKRPIIYDTEDHITAEAVNSSATHIVPAGSILVVTRSGILEHSLPIAKAGRPVALNQDMKALVLSSGWNPDYVIYALRRFSDEILSNCSKRGTTVANIDSGRFLTFEIPAAPPEEQDRIVAKLDSLLECSKNVREELSHIPKLVERYKQAILASAFRSHLGHGSKTAWRIQPLYQFADLQLGKMLDKAKNKGIETPYLRNINVRWLNFDLSDLLEMRFTEAEKEKFAIRDGDIIICEGGEPGRAAIWKGGETTMKYQKALHRVRLRPGYNQEWIAYQLYYLAKSGELADHFTGTTIKHLPKEALAEVEFLVPPESEQRRLVAAINRAFEVTERLLSESTRATGLVDRLDQAILRRAFRGELVMEGGALKEERLAACN